MTDNYERVYAQVDLDAVRGNMDRMSANLREGTEMLAVIKADGYGHGAVPIARELEPLPYLYGFAVATAEEALILRGSGIGKPILILGYSFPFNYEELILSDVRLTVFREDTLPALTECVRRLNGERGKDGKLKARVHIKVDTGMTRIGVTPDGRGLDFVRRALETEEVEVEGIFTHFARADEEGVEPALRQLARFQYFLGRIRTELGAHIPVKHCSNSAALIRMREADMDAVRAGIALYGLWPSEEMPRDGVRLEPALSLFSQVVQLRETEPGVEVSYGGTYTTGRKTLIATIPLGYADGYPRGLSNKGSVLIRGRRAPIVGRVCMDQFMADVTDIPGVSLGDKVTLIGADGEERITMEELGGLSGRFNYELACDLNKRVPRVYVKGGKVVRTKDYFRDIETD